MNMIHDRRALGIVPDSIICHIDTAWRAASSWQIVCNTAEHSSLSEPDVSKEHSSSLEEFHIRSRDLKKAITRLDTS